MGEWEHVHWIGGSPCAGKSTIADTLAQQYKMNLYRCDDYWDRHTQIEGLSEDSWLYKFSNMSPQDIFMRPVDVQLETEIAVYQEEFPHILRDLADYPTDKLLLVEGTALQPDLVVPLLQQSHHAIWIVPTEELQRKTYPKRGWMHGVFEQTSNPEIAMDNWMARDVRYARWIAERVKFHQQEIIIVDGERSIDHNADIVRKRFNLK